MRIQFPHQFHRGDELRVVFELQPALVDRRYGRVHDNHSFRCVHRRRSGPVVRHGSLGVRARVLMFRKCSAPTVGEIEDRHVQHEHGIVLWGSASNAFARAVSEIVLTILRVHECTLNRTRQVTTQQWRDFRVPLSRQA